MHITDQVLHPSYMYMLEVVFAEVWADRKIAIVELLGRNFDPEHIGPLVGQTVARMAQQGRFAGQVGFHSDQRNWAAVQKSWPKPQADDAMKASEQTAVNMRSALDLMSLSQTATEYQRCLQASAKMNADRNSNLEAWQRKQNGN